MFLLEISRETRLTMFVLAIAAIIVIIVYLIYRNNKKEKQTSASLKIEYDAAIKKGDKKLALQKGREYYRSLRGGETLSIYDEQAITNDISTM